MLFTNLYDAKTHLKIEDDYNDDDIYIVQLLNVSETAIMNYLNDSLSGYTESTLPTPIKQAIYFLIANFYLNRQMVSFASQAIEIPYTFNFLLNNYKNPVIC